MACNLPSIRRAYMPLPWPTDGYTPRTLSYYMSALDIVIRVSVEYSVNLSETDPVIPYLEDALMSLREALQAVNPNSPTTLSATVGSTNNHIFELEES
jgi:hypothetical protein